MKISILISSVAILFTTPAYPWGAEGHQAIGEAARTMLTPKARIEIQKLLGDDDLASVAVWLDDVRNLAHHHSGPLRDDPEAMAFNAKFPENASWHFVDLPVGFTKYSLGGPFSSPNDIVHALGMSIDVFEGKSSQFTKVQALRIIVHLVGDIHQPLHTVSGYYNLTDLEQPQLISDPNTALGKAAGPRGKPAFLYQEPGTPRLMGHQAGREGCDFNLFPAACRGSQGGSHCTVNCRRLSRMADEMG